MCDILGALDSLGEDGCVGIIKVGGKTRNFTFKLKNDIKRGDLPEIMESLGKSLEIVFFKSYSDMDDVEKQDFIAGGGLS